MPDEEFRNKDAQGTVMSKNGSLIDQEILKFYQEYSGWFHDRLLEEEIVVPLPKFQMKKRETKFGRCGWNDLFDLSPVEAGIELRYSRLCERHKLFGINQIRSPIFSQLILRRDNTISFQEFRDMAIPADWSDERAYENYRAVVGADKSSIFERRASAAGRLICTSNFRKQRDALKKEWENLPSGERPLLPLSRSPQIGTTFPDTDVASQEGLLEFTKHFDLFCDAWHLLGMITWDLPDPEGSHDLGDDPHLPWTFPSLKEDGYDLHTRDAAAKLAEQKGFDDRKSWKNYSHILKIDFWERIAISRHSSNGTRKLNKTKLDDVLSSLLNIEPNRVKKLRIEKDAGINDKRFSLKGYR